MPVSYTHLDVYKRQDTMGAKDSGWIQIYAENNQEAYDNMVMAYNIAENKDVRLPIDRKSTRLNSSHSDRSRMPSSA